MAKKGTRASVKTKARAYSKRTKSICPVCLSVISARVFEKGGRILIEKSCRKHGRFEDVYWSDAKTFKRFLKYQIPGSPIGNPQAKSKGNCPLDCGLCDGHQTKTLLAEMDLTNRCNQRCPVCFANADAAGYVYEPTLEQVKAMLDMLRNQKPNPVNSVQFLGGEPTLHPRLFEIVEYAKKVGFVDILIASNGIKIAQDAGFARRLKEAGARSIYLQFDGLTPESYTKLRGYNALPMKMKAIGNLRKVGVSACLVPTVIKGVNDGQLGDIIEFGRRNIGTIKAVNFQPLSFIGRTGRKSVNTKRMTITDIMELVERQTNGKIKKEYWMPISAFAPIEMFYEKFFNRRVCKSSTHVHCGAGVYIFEKGDGYITLNEFVDLDRVREIFLEESQSKKRNLLGSAMANLALVAKLKGTIDFSKIPDYIDWKGMITSAIFRGDLPQKLKDKAMFIGCMHFMDPYNFDMDRVQRCCIHYATPDGREIPFCTYNIFHRENVEKKYSSVYKKASTKR